MPGELEIGPLKPPLALDEGDEEAAREVAQLGDALEHAVPGALLPALDHDLAVPGVERRDHALAGQLAQHLGPRGRAEHHLHGAPVEPADRRVGVPDAAADPAAREADQVLDHGRCCRAERGVEIDHRDLADPAEAARASGRGSPASSALVSPPTSWTAWPSWRSIEGTIMAAASLTGRFLSRQVALDPMLCG